MVTCIRTVCKEHNGIMYCMLAYCLSMVWVHTLQSLFWGVLDTCILLCMLFNAIRTGEVV